MSMLLAYLFPFLIPHKCKEKKMLRSLGNPNCDSGCCGFESHRSPQIQVLSGDTKYGFLIIRSVSSKKRLLRNARSQCWCAVRKRIKPLKPDASGSRREAIDATGRRPEKQIDAICVELERVDLPMT